MRKTRLVILPGVRSITQIGCLLLFLACPTIAFKGQERRDVDPICTLNELKNWWLPSDGEKVDEIMILRQEKRHCIDNRPTRSKGTYNFEKRTSNNTLSEARNIPELRQYSQSRNSLRFGQLCELPRSSERFAATRKEYRANVHNQRMNERRISENFNQRVSRRDILKPNVIVETQLNINTLQRESRNNIHRSNIRSKVNELRTEQTFTAGTLRRDAQRKDRITESGRRQFRTNIVGRNSRIISKDVQFERNDAGIASLNLRRTVHNIRSKYAHNEINNNRLTRDSPKGQTEEIHNDNRRETMNKRHNTRSQLQLERIEPRNSRKIEDRRTYSKNQHIMDRRELDKNNRRSAEANNPSMNTQENAARREENALKKQQARNNRSNSREDNIRVNTIASRESRETRLTRERSRRSNVLMQLDSNRIDTRSFERRASAVRSPPGESQKRQVIENTRDSTGHLTETTKREEQENVFPRHKRSVSRVGLRYDSIQSRNSPLDAVRRLDRRYRSDGLIVERDSIRRMQSRRDSLERFRSAEFTENSEYRRMKSTSRSNTALKDERRNTNSAHRERLDSIVSRQSRLLQERNREETKSAWKDLMNNNRDHDARLNIAIRSSERKFREESSTKEDGQVPKRHVLDRGNKIIRKIRTVSSERRQINSIPSSSSSIDSRRSFNRDRTDNLRREMRRNHDSKPNLPTASSKQDNSENIENRNNRLYINHRTERVQSDRRSRVLVRNVRSVSRDHLQSHLQKSGFSQHIPEYTTQTRELENRRAVSSYDSRRHSTVQPSYRESRDANVKYNPDSLMRRESPQIRKRTASREQIQIDERQAETTFIRARRVENERSDSQRNSRNKVHSPESRIYDTDKRNARKASHQNGIVFDTNDRSLTRNGINYFPEQVHAVRTDSRQSRSSTTTGRISSRRNNIPVNERSTEENLRDSQSRFNENTIKFNNRAIRKDRREIFHHDIRKINPKNMESITARRLISDGLQSRDSISTSERRGETKFQLSKLRREARENIQHKVSRKMTTMGSDKQGPNGNKASLGDFKDRTDNTQQPRLGTGSTDRAVDAQYRRNLKERTIQRREEMDVNRIQSDLRSNSLERNSRRVSRERHSSSTINSRSSTQSLERTTKTYGQMARTTLAQSRHRGQTMSIRNEQTAAERQLGRFQRNERKNVLSNTRSRTTERRQSDPTESTPLLQETIRQTQSRRKSTENISHDRAGRTVRSVRREIRSTSSENVKEQQRNAQRDNRNILVRDKRSLSAERLGVYPVTFEDSPVRQTNRVNRKDRSDSPIRESDNIRRTKLMHHLSVSKSERQASLTINLRNTERRYLETLERNSRNNDVLRKQILNSQERDHGRRIESRSDRLPRSERNTQLAKRETRRNSSPVNTRTTVNQSGRVSTENFEIYKTQEFINTRRRLELNRNTRSNSRDRRVPRETSLILTRRTGDRANSDSQIIERRKNVIGIEPRTTREGADNRNVRHQEGTVTRIIRNNVFVTNSRSLTRDSLSLTKNLQRDARTEELSVRSVERSFIDKVQIGRTTARQKDILQNGQQSARNTKPIVRQDFPKQRRMESLSADQRNVVANNIISNKKEISEQRDGIHQGRLRLIVDSRRSSSRVLSLGKDKSGYSSLKELRTTTDIRDYRQLQSRAPKNIILRERELGLSRRENRREINRRESRDTHTITTYEQFQDLGLIQKKERDSRKSSDFSRRDSRENVKKPETRIEFVVRESRREARYRESRDASRQPEQTSKVLKRATVSQERFVENRWVVRKSINEAVNRNSFPGFRTINEGLIDGKLFPSDRSTNNNWIQFSRPLHFTKTWIQDIVHTMESTYWHNHIIQDALLGVIVTVISLYTSSYWSKQRDFNFNLLNCRRIFF